MKLYWVKAPFWLKKLFPGNLIWNMPQTPEPSIYITFDDGPHLKATPFVLEQLDKYNATATFFCIGKNVVAHPDIYRQIIQQGHTTGNHTHNHLNGWKSDDSIYLENIAQASQYIESRLLRPPYGRIKSSQMKKLLQKDARWKVYMWDVLSADFDKDITSEKCLKNVIKYISPGSIVVFHDSEKAWNHMSYTLPKVLEYCRQKNWKVIGLPKN